MNRSEDDRAAPLIAFAGGGTGGHLFPALAVAETLKRRLGAVRFVFLCTTRPIDRRVLEAGDHPWVPQVLPAFRKAPWQMLHAYLGLRRAVRACRGRFRADRPALVVGTGGLASFPAVREASRADIPVVLLNPDAIPGRANSVLSRYARTVCVQWPESIRHFGRNRRVVVTGCPVREEFLRATRSGGMARFGLDESRRTLLITGASQGARNVNEAAIRNIGFIQEKPDWQVLHLTGDADFDVVAEAYRRSSVPARVLPFTEHMADALAAADLVVGRAGASFLAELTAVGRAAVLLPYPYHRDQHQLANARCLNPSHADHAVGIVEDRRDAALNGPALWRALEPLMNYAERRTAMARASRSMGRPDAAEAVADQLLRLALPDRPSRARETVEAFC